MSEAWVTEDDDLGPYYLATSQGRRIFALPAPGRQNIAIPNQIERAQFLVKKAARKGLFDQHLKLLVFGAGAAGMSAAITAANLGIGVSVRTRDRRLFLPQARCRTRWLHPHQYDWPSNSWKTATFSLGTDHPLNWTADWAWRIAAGWTKELQRFRRANPLMQISYGTEFAVTPSWDAFISNVDSLKEPEYGVILFCLGLSESCAIENTGYCGFRFWQTDPLEKSQAGHSLISGGGDGALQDLLRISFASPASQVFSKLENAFLRSRDQSLWRNFIHRVVDAESQFESANEVLQRKYETEVKILFDEPSAWDTFQRVLHPLLKFNFEKTDLILVHKGACLAKCFPLNRLLALILNEYVVRKHGHPVIHPHTSIEKVMGQGHACRHRPEHCHGKRHKVTFTREAASEHPPTSEYHVIVVRHGTKRRLPEPPPHPR